MDLSLFQLTIVRGDGSEGNIFRTKEDQITIGQDVQRDIRIKIEEAEPLMCKISADQHLRGRVKLTNYSQLNPVKVNGHPIVEKCYLKHSDEIEVAGRRFVWRNVHKRTGTPNALIAPSTVPAKKITFRDTFYNAASNLKKRFTFASSSSGEDVGTSEQKETKDTGILPEETVKTPVINKENHTPRLYENLDLSGTLIVSCTPRSVIDTGRRNLNNSQKRAETPSEPYMTPKSVLSEFNNDTLTPRSQKKSSMYLIDFTTPHPQASGQLSATMQERRTTPILRRRRSDAGHYSSTTKNAASKGLLRSALKNSAAKPNTGQLKKKLSLAFEDHKQKLTRKNENFQGAGLKKLLKTPQAIDSPKLLGVRELLKTPRASFGDVTTDFEGITELLKTPIKTISSEGFDPVSSPEEKFDELIGKPQIKKTYLRRSKSLQFEHETIKPDVVEWIDSVMAASALDDADVQPNENTQILSSRFSDITNESLQNITNRTTSICYSAQTTMLCVSPISKIDVTYEGTAETSDVIDLNTLVVPTESSLRSTRKRINRALVSLNTSGISDVTDQQDDSILVSNEMEPISEGVENESYEYAQLETLSKIDTPEQDLNNLEDKSPEDSFLGNLSEAPTSKNIKCGFTTPQRSVREPRITRHTVASKRDLPKREIDHEFMLRQNLTMKLQKTDEEISDEKLVSKSPNKTFDENYDNNQSKMTHNSSSNHQNETFTVSPQNRSSTTAMPLEKEKDIINTHTEESLCSPHSIQSKDETGNIYSTEQTHLDASITENNVVDEASVHKSPDSKCSPKAQGRKSSRLSRSNVDEEVDKSVLETLNQSNMPDVNQENVIQSTSLFGLESKSPNKSISDTMRPGGRSSRTASKGLLRLFEKDDCGSEASGVFDKSVTPETKSQENNPNSGQDEKVDEKNSTQNEDNEIKMPDNHSDSNQKAEETLMPCESLNLTPQSQDTNMESDIQQSPEQNKNITEASAQPGISTPTHEISVIEIPDTPIFAVPKPPVIHERTPRPPPRESVIYVGSGYATPIRNSVIVIEDTPVANRATPSRMSSFVHELQSPVNRDASIESVLENMPECSNLNEFMTPQRQPRKLETPTSLPSHPVDVRESFTLAINKEAAIEQELKNMNMNPAKDNDLVFKTPQPLKQRMPRTPRTVTSARDLKGKELSHEFEQRLNTELELKNLSANPTAMRDNPLTPQPIRRSARNGPTRTSGLLDYRDQMLRPEVSAEINEQRDARRALALMKEERESIDILPKLSSALLASPHSPQLQNDSVRRNSLENMNMSNNEKSSESKLNSSSTRNASNRQGLSMTDTEIENILTEPSRHGKSGKRKLYTPTDETPKSSMDSSLKSDEIRKAYLKESGDKKAKRTRGKAGILKKGEPKPSTSKTVQFNDESESSGESVETYDKIETNPKKKTRKPATEAVLANNEEMQTKPRATRRRLNEPAAAKDDVEQNKTANTKSANNENVVSVKVTRARRTKKDVPENTKSSSEDEPVTINKDNKHDKTPKQDTKAKTTVRKGNQKKDINLPNDATDSNDTTNSETPAKQRRGRPKKAVDPAPSILTENVESTRPRRGRQGKAQIADTLDDSNLNDISQVPTSTPLVTKTTRNLRQKINKNEDIKTPEISQRRGRRQISKVQASEPDMEETKPRNTNKISEEEKMDVGVGEQEKNSNSELATKMPAFTKSPEKARPTRRGRKPAAIQKNQENQTDGTMITEDVESTPKPVKGRGGRRDLSQIKLDASAQQTEAIKPAGRARRNVKNAIESSNVHYTQDEQAVTKGARVTRGRPKKVNNETAETVAEPEIKKRKTKKRASTESENDLSNQKKRLKVDENETKEPTRTRRARN